jgi:hypothetical protein
MFKTIPLNRDHLDAAAALVSSRYQALREKQPLLPIQYQDPHNFIAMLQHMMDAGSPGAAAFQDGQLVGFLAGWLMPDFRGKRSVYSPEWANAAFHFSAWLMKESYEILLFCNYSSY